MDMSYLKKPDKGVWFVFQKDVKVKIKSVRPFETREFTKVNTFEEVQEGITFTRVDSDKTALDIRCATIVDWENLKEGKKDFPCNQENRRFLLENWNDFLLFVIEKSTIIEKGYVEHEKILEKNS